jgi:glycosyltransferase involved in cell wall biosynthesis
MRMASLIQALSDFFEVTAAFPAAQVPEAMVTWANNRNICLEPFIPPLLRPFQLLEERFIIILNQSNLRFRKSENDFLEAAFHSSQPDLVWLETPYLLRYALKWKNKASIVVDYWGTSNGAKRLFAHSSAPSRIWRWLQWRAAKGGEVRYAPQIENIVCVSALDAAYFHNLAPCSRIWTIPNGILGKDPLPQSPNIMEDPRVMIFTGDMSYYPNVDAMIWFTKEIFPLIRSQVSDAKLIIAGREPPPVIKKLGERKGIEVKGYVQDLAEAISASALYILPMRLGSGIRSKLFDVFPLGKPIVTTGVGAEGLELKHEENCFIADSAKDLANACVKLLNNEKERKRLGMSAQRLATETYSQERVNRLVFQAVTQILEESRLAKAKD